MVVTGEGADSVPLGGDNLAARAVTALVQAVGAGDTGLARRGHRDQEADPGRGRAGRRQRRRRRRAGRLQRAVGRRAEPAGAGRHRRAGRQRRGVRPGRRHRDRPGPGSTRSPRRSRPGPTTGCSRSPPSSCPRPRCTRRATGSGRRRMASPHRPRGPRPGGPGGPGPPGRPQLNTALMTALRSGDPAELGPLLSNDLQPAAISLLPRLRLALSVGRASAAHSARSCPGPGRPAPTWPGTPRARVTWQSR